MNELSRRIGKFDSPESLLRAYESLESEFTKRSQRLRDAEKHIDSLRQDLDSAEKHKSIAKKALDSNDFVRENVLAHEGIRRLVIEEYLTKLNSAGGARVMSGGIGKSALTPPAKPSSLAEAKRLADLIINS